MKNRNYLLLAIIATTIFTTLTSWSSASGKNPKEVAKEYLKGLTTHNLELIKQTTNPLMYKNASMGIASANEQELKKISGKNPAFVSQKKVGNLYLESFSWGKDTLILKLAKYDKEWKVSGAGLRLGL